MLGIVTTVGVMVFLNQIDILDYYRIAIVFGVVLFIFLAVIVIRKTLLLNKTAVEMREILQANEEVVAPQIDIHQTYNNLQEIKTLIRTQKKRTETSEEFKTDLITNMSHDLRTPLTSIITFGELLENETDEEKRAEYVGIINQKSARMKRMIDDLFEVTKMDNAQIELEKSTVDMTAMTRQIIDEVADEFEDKNLKLVTHLPSEPVEMTIDAEKIWRALDNLLMNAKKYSLEGSRGYVNMNATDSDVSIEVKNTSRVQLNEQAEKLVERFARGDKNRTTEGSGLGLAIVDSIVKLHEGNFAIAVDGDLFKATITLPR
jgi:signal transduction histidine kinase